MKFVVNQLRCIVCATTSLYNNDCNMVDIREQTVNELCHLDLLTRDLPPLRIFIPDCDAQYTELQDNQCMRTENPALLASGLLCRP